MMTGLTTPLQRVLPLLMVGWATTHCTFGPSVDPVSDGGEHVNPQFPLDVGEAGIDPGGPAVDVGTPHG